MLQKPQERTESDRILIKYVKMSGTKIAPLSANIFNNCIGKGSFPKVLKVAEVIPTFKRGKKKISSNYRQISLLNPVAQVFEKCLHEQLTKFFDGNKLFNMYQYGFKKNCSTAEAELDMHNQMID